MRVTARDYSEGAGSAQEEQRETKEGGKSWVKSQGEVNLPLSIACQNIQCGKKPPEICRHYSEVTENNQMSFGFKED